MPAKRGEGGLVVEREAEGVEIGAGFLLDPVGDQLEPGPRRLGRRLAGQPLAHDQADRGGERHLLAAARAGQRIGPQPHLGQPGEIGAHPGHGARAERLDPRLLGGVEHRARRLVGRGDAAVQRRIVMAEAQRRGVGEAARLGGLLGADRAARHRRLDRLARHARRVAGEAQLDLGIAGDRPRRPGQRVAEGFEGIVFGHRLWRCSRPAYVNRAVCSRDQPVRGVLGVRGVRGVEGVRGVVGVLGVRGVRGVEGVRGVDGVRGVVGVVGVVRRRRCRGASSAWWGSSASVGSRLRVAARG